MADNKIQKAEDFPAFGVVGGGEMHSELSSGRKLTFLFSNCLLMADV